MTDSRSSTLTEPSPTPSGPETSPRHPLQLSGMPLPSPSTASPRAISQASGTLSPSQSGAVLGKLSRSHVGSLQRQLATVIEDEMIVLALSAPHSPATPVGCPSNATNGFE